MSKSATSAPKSTLFSLLSPYKGFIIGLIVLAVLSNGLNLLVPTIIAHGIDGYTNGNFVLNTILIEFFVVSLSVFVFTYVQGMVQVYASEKVARDLRARLIAKISEQQYLFIQKANPAKLLTNITGDVDSVKSFVAQGVASVVSSIVIIIGASVILLIIDWKLALAVLAVIPFIALTFYTVFGKVRALFKRRTEVIDWLNKVINESILGAALIRVLHSHRLEFEKFEGANERAKAIGFDILKLFASMIPVITFLSSIATLIIVTLGGHFVIAGTMTLGSFTAFSSYIVMLIFPIMILGFMSTVIAQASASYARLTDILLAPKVIPPGTVRTDLKGNIEFKNVSLSYGEKRALNNVSFKIAAGTKTAIIGPTGGGKSQLLYALMGLIIPDSGEILYDGLPIAEYDPQTLYKDIGFVFQDSILFNMSAKENIAFSESVSDESLHKAIATAELQSVIDALPEKLATIVSERGTSLSGGQKQRMMLARALALNPEILLLDDFTARVDMQTEQKILTNVAKNYPQTTLISVTQRIASVEHYDQIILLMEGEVLAQGTHQQLFETSPEYMQIYKSQRSTNAYELHT